MERKKSILKKNNLLNQIRSFLLEEDRMVKDAGKLFSSRIVILLLTLALTPVITRIYSPGDYGHYSLYTTIIRVLVVVGTLSYPLAILSTSANNSGVAFSKSLKSIILSFIILIPVFYFLSELNIHDSQFSYLQNIWYLLPVGFAIAALQLTYRSVYESHKEFGILSRVNVLESTTSKSFNILFGFLGFTSIGLILSELVSRVLSTSVLLRKIPRPIPPKSLKDHEIAALRKYPRTVMPSELISLLSTYLIIWFLVINFSLEDLGRYWLAFGLLGLILNSLTNTLQPVVTQRLVDAKHGKNKLNSKVLFGALILLAVLAFTPFVFIPESLYTFYLGPEWLGIGFYLRVIAIWFIFLLVDQSLENSFLVFGKEKIALWTNIIDLLVQVTLIAFAYINSVNLYLFIGFFVVGKILMSTGKLSIVFLIISKQYIHKLD